MTIEELKITNEDINLLNEMKENCLKASVYKDEKRLLKANAITKFLVEHQEKQELIEYLKEKKNELYKKVSDYNDLARIGKETDIEFFEALILERKIDVYEEILSKIEKR